MSETSLTPPASAPLHGLVLAGGRGSRLGTDKGALDDVPFDPYWNEAVAGSVFDFMSYGCTR